MSTLKNPLQLSSEAIALLRSALKSFEKLDADLPERLLRYLVDGEDEAAIADLSDGLEQAYQQYQQTLTNQTGSAAGVNQLMAGLRALCDLDFLSHQQDNSLEKFLTTVTVSDVAFYCRFSEIWNGPAYPGRGGSLHYGQQLLSLAPRIRLFLNMLVQCRSYSYTRDSPGPTTTVTAEIIDQMYAEAGEPKGSFAHRIYLIDPNSYHDREIAHYGPYLSEFVEFTLKHRDVVQQALTQPERERRIHALRMLHVGQVPVKEFASAIATAAVSSAKSEREAAAQLLEQDLETALPLLKEKAESGSSPQRQAAIKLLWDLAGETVKPFLEQRLETEKAAKVQSTIQQLIAAPTVESVLETEKTELPPIPPVAFEAPISASVKDALENIRTTYQQAQAQEIKDDFQSLKDGHIKADYLLSVLSRRNIKKSEKAELEKLLNEIENNAQLDEQQAFQQFSEIISRAYAPENKRLEKLETLLEKGRYPELKFCQMYGYQKFSAVAQAIQSLMALPELTLMQAVRFLCLTRQVYGEKPTDGRSARYYAEHLLGYEGHDWLQTYRNHHSEACDLRQLAAVLESLNIPSVKISHEMLSAWNYSGFWHWGDDAIWPYYAERLPILSDAIAQKPTDRYDTYSVNRSRKNVLQVLKTFPKAPAELIAVLWRLAFEGNKTERQVAQQSLNAYSETAARVVQTLSDTNREMRTIAATWLSDLGDASAIAPLKKALKKEKSEPVKDVMLRSLEKLGASVDEFFDRDNLLKDLQKLLKKGIPNSFSWFPFQAMPTLHWQDTGEEVSTDLLKGLILQCLKQKNIEPGPIFRRYLDLLNPAERAELGLFILKAWLAQDTAPAYTPEQAHEQAQKYAKQQYQRLQRYRQQYPQAAASSSYYNSTEEQLYQQQYNYLSNECIGSATKEKGILAIAAACCDAGAVAPIQTYLKTWYGKRATQCKALLKVLSWIEDDSAIQLLLSVANRFRTKGIQKEAEKLVNELAERKGWSRDELADRTIPTAGFVDGVEQSLDYGDRKFTLLLSPNMTLVLKKPDGKVIKSLPAARKDEDPDQVKAAKKQLSDAKKQLKQVLKMQQERLYEAMCTQRAWRFADWDLYLNQHPIVGRYCQQLVWAIYEKQGENETLTPTFRPLEDRSFTDADDEEITPAPDALIRLAHRCHVSAETATAWQTHFADYDVIPLLQQFRPNTYQLPENQQTATELKDFEGYIVEAFQLRGLATKRGYTRGQTEDAGWFYDYRKTFPSLGLEAVIDFTGNFLPEENRTVALTQLSFEKLPETGESTSYYRRTKLPLSEIPTVLMSETWNDLSAIASQGTGHDPNWEKNVEY